MKRKTPAKDVETHIGDRVKPETYSTIDRLSKGHVNENGEILFDVDWRSQWIHKNALHDPQDLKRFQNGEPTHILETNSECVLIQWNKDRRVSLREIKGELDPNCKFVAGMEMMNSSWEASIRPNGTYDADVLSATPEKERTNSQFAEACKKRVEKGDKKGVVRGDIFYLDAANCATTAALDTVFGGKNPPRVFAVNDDGNTVATMVRKRDKTKNGIPLITFHGLLSTFISTCRNDTVCGANFDYCSTFGGGAKCKPKHDLEMAFRKKIFQHDAVLRVVLCLRNSAWKPVDIVQSITKMAILNGYKPQTTHNDSYGTMFTVQMTL